MSALQAPLERDSQHRPTLRRVPPLAARISRVPSLLIIGLAAALGLIGVVVLSVQVQEQADRLSDLQTTDAQLGYQQASLQTRLDSLDSSAELMSRARALGMRPNLTPSFIDLRTGKVVGRPVAVSGTQASEQGAQSVDQQAAAIAAARGVALRPAKPQQTTPAATATKPATTKPATTKPATSKPTTNKQATSKPATTKPKPATTKPVTNRTAGQTGNNR